MQIFQKDNRPLTAAEAEKERLLKIELMQELKEDIHRAQIELATNPDLTDEQKDAYRRMIDASEGIFFSL